ncbi:putative spermidine/putrescine transport system permease protein/spermidine/putrescine transport system permease protein [Ochrobactrum sp. P6BSIII]|jgi:putative spermidine/putrescine transport system permease protein/spermidine/putrescine transport system permease protein|uniref:ABC transporter permease n=1 Tax=unclassified Ochrobactrum TaxID=239106 RepID=UPI000991DC8E|nr:putative spermidine/putrescine transport system permease protein/spermidine/putrescine transport system permease protein [Ochrobactrum sp. P6BSIII]
MKDAVIAAPITSSELDENSRLLNRERRNEIWSMLGLTTPALLIVGVLMVAPLVWLLSMSVIDVTGQMSFENYRLFFSEEAYVEMFLNTFRIALIVTVICVLLGYPVAYLISILPSKWAGLLMLLVLVPFWTSGLVRTFAWLIILQRNGVVNKTLAFLGVIDRPLTLVHNTTGTVIGMVHIMVPFLVLPLYASMKTIDANLMRAAANVGSSPTHAFFRIFLPLSMPGLVAGTVMVFVMCLGFYITPALLGGGKVKLIAQRIEESISLYPTWGPAAALAVLLLAMTALCLWISLVLVRWLSSGR